MGAYQMCDPLNKLIQVIFWKWDDKVSLLQTCFSHSIQDEWWKKGEKEVKSEYSIKIFNSLKKIQNTTLK